MHRRMAKKVEIAAAEIEERGYQSKRNCMTGSLGIVAESTVVAFATLSLGPEFAGDESNLVLFRNC